MALIEDLAYYLIVDTESSEVLGYAAYGTAEIITSRRRGLRRERQHITELMSNVYFLNEGNPPGFSACDEEERDLYRQSLIRYRGVVYRLQPAPEAMRAVIWDEYLGESFE